MIYNLTRKSWGFLFTISHCRKLYVSFRWEISYLGWVNAEWIFDL